MSPPADMSRHPEPRRNATMTRMRVYLLLLLVLAAAAYPAWLVAHRVDAPAATAQAVEPAQTVSDIVVRPQAWQDRLKAFGQTRAVQGAALSAPVPGIVDEIDFQSGQDVKAGTVLLRLRLYDDPAKLQQLQAEVALYNTNLARDQKQFEAQAVSHATLDLDTANLRSFQAQVQAQAQAMDEKIVRAPFSGRLGIREVDLGQYLPPGTAVTTLQALDPIFVDFSVPQQQVGDIHPGGAVDVGVDTYPGRVFHATVQALDSRIDAQSRMVSVRARLDNRDHALLPGMFAVAHLDLGPARTVLAVPQTAISFNPYGDFVYVLTPQPGHAPGKPQVFLATSRVVTLGETQGDRVVVTAGLHDGDTVVTAGQIKLRNGATVVIDNRVEPPDALSPNPPEE